MHRIMETADSMNVKSTLHCTCFKSITYWYEYYTEDKHVILWSKKHLKIRICGSYLSCGGVGVYCTEWIDFPC
jgi:hypothetical protein